MRKLFRAACLLTFATLAGCGGDSSSTPTTSTQEAASTPRAGAQALKLTTAPTGLVQRVTSRGTTVQLDGSFHNAVVARRNADGSISTSCNDEQQQAEAFMQGAAGTTTQREVQ